MKTQSQAFATKLFAVGSLFFFAFSGTPAIVAGQGMDMGGGYGGGGYGLYGGYGFAGSYGGLGLYDGFETLEAQTSAPIVPLLSNGSDPKLDEIERQIFETERDLQGQRVAAGVVSSSPPSSGSKQLAATIEATTQKLTRLQNEQTRIVGRSAGWVLADDTKAKQAAAEMSFSCARGERMVRMPILIGMTRLGCLNSKGYPTQTISKTLMMDVPDKIQRVTYERDSENRLVREVSKDEKGGTIYERTFGAKDQTIKRFKGTAVSSECTYASKEAGPVGFGAIGSIGGGLWMDQAIQPMSTDERKTGTTQEEHTLARSILQAQENERARKALLKLLQFDRETARRSVESLQERYQADEKASTPNATVKQSLKEASAALDRIDDMIGETTETIKDASASLQNLRDQKPKLREKHLGWGWPTDAEKTEIDKDGTYCAAGEKLVVNTWGGSALISLPGTACIDGKGFFTKQSFADVFPGAKAENKLTTKYQRENGRLTKMTTVDANQRPTFEWERKSGTTVVRYYNEGKSWSTCSYYGDSPENRSSGATDSGTIAR